MSGVAVSVICNVYNQEQYLRDTLEGFVMQRTDFPVEVLVHDDASTDGSAAIIREYAEQYPALIKPLIEEENQYSKGAGRVFAIQKARVTGKYVAFCEGDDYWTDPLKLQKQYDYLEAHPDCSLCATSGDWLNMKTGRVEKQGKVPADRDFTAEELITGRERPFMTVAVMVPAEVWLTLPTYRFPIGDYPLTIYAATRGTVHMLADVCCVYRWYAAGSWTARMDGDAKRVEISEKMIAALERFDESTGGRYAAPVQERIRSHRYTAAILRGDWAAVRSEELYPIYKSRDLLHRLSDRLRCRFPGLYKKLRHLIRK